ncbi:MAG: succinate CoA transferase [Oscillospiraceae bacterium]|nr:succinate CoA transferase [Oscillospiraceae bacterium]
MLEGRIRCAALREKLTDAETAARLIEDGMIVAVSGFTPAGCPKEVPLALARQVSSGERQVRISLWTGASTGREIDQALAGAGVIARRLPYQSDPVLRAAVNGRGKAEVAYTDLHLSQVADRARRGFLGKVDVCVVEACVIREDGGLIPTTSVGNTPCFITEADTVIVELNLAQPAELEGLHDIYRPDGALIPIDSAAVHIGKAFMPCPPEKIAAIVVTNRPDDLADLSPVDENSRAMAGHICALLKRESASGRMPGSLTIQAGVGNVANAVLEGLMEYDLEPLEYYAEVIQDSALNLLDAGKMKALSGTALTLSPGAMRRFFDRLTDYRRNVVLRPQEISNNPAVIARLGLVAMNTAIEADIYGNVNSTHVLGTDMMNGIGGSGDFARSAALTIFITSSTAKSGSISSIVPMVSHTDHTEHDVDILVTEQGLADLRNKAPRERAEEIIENCAHPDYKPLLRDYFRSACAATGNAHIPHLLEECFSFHTRYKQTGTMRLPEQGGT